MLSLIPALLLLAFHGPAAVERFGHEGRIPEALRALESAWVVLEKEADAEGDSKELSRRRQAFASLAALTADPEFSRAVSELLGLDLESSAQTDSLIALEPENLPQWAGSSVSEGQTSAGFLASRRTRDGPWLR